MTIKQRLLSKVFTYRQMLADQDLALYVHCQKVAMWAFYIADKLGLPPEEKIQVVCGALLHDLGRLGLEAPHGGWSRRAQSELPEHAARGVGMIEEHGDGEALAAILPVILHHHEAVDGSGYPGRLSGEAIPLGARIVAIADAMDMIMTVPGKDGRLLPIGKVLDSLLELAGTRFDESIVLEMLRNLYDMRMLYASGLRPDDGAVSPDDEGSILARHGSDARYGEGHVNRRGRPSKVDPDMNSYILELKRRYPNYSAFKIARLVEQERGLSISRQTVWRHLRAPEGEKL